MFAILSRKSCWDPRLAMQVLQRAANMYFTVRG